jgi:hypothetical protein
MLEIQLELGQTVATEDPRVVVSIDPASVAGKSVKLLLVVESQDGRRSLPAELLLVADAPVPA